MHHLFKALTDLALDPFARLAAGGDTRRALSAVGLSSGDLERATASLAADPESVESASFSSCETCIDPGNDPDPFAS